MSDWDQFAKAEENSWDQFQVVSPNEEPPAEESDNESSVGGSFKRGLLRARQGLEFLGVPTDLEGAAKTVMGGRVLGNPDAQRKGMETEKQIRAIPQNETMQKAYKAASKEEGLVDTAGAFIENVWESDEKLRFFTETAAELIPQIGTMALGTKGMGALTAGGKIATLSPKAKAAINLLGGGGASSFLNTYGPNVAEALEKGLEFDQAQARAALQSAAQGGVDALTSAVIPFKIGPNQFTNIPAQTLLQILGGGTGEAVRSKVVGEEVNNVDVVVEGLLEAIGLPGDFLAAAWAGAWDKVGTKADGESDNDLPPMEDVETESEATRDIPQSQIEAGLERINAAETVEEKLKIATELAGEFQEKVAIDPAMEQPLVQGVDPDAQQETQWPTTVQQYDDLGVQFGSRTGDGTADEQWTAEELDTKLELIDRLVAENELNNEDALRMQSELLKVQEGVKGIRAALEDGEFRMTTPAARRVWNGLFARDLGTVKKSMEPGDVVAVGFGRAMLDTTSAGDKQIENGVKLAMGAIHNWNKMFNPGAKVVLVEGNTFDQRNSHLNNPMGSLSGGKDGIHYISLQKTLTQGHYAKAQIYSVLAHEYGHLLINERFKTASSAVKAGLINGYRNWLAERVINKDTEKVGDLKETRLNPFGEDRGERHRLNRPLWSNSFFDGQELVNQRPRDYYLSFNEYLAESISTVLTKEQTVRGPVRHWLKRTETMLRRFFKSVAGQNIGVTKSVDDWMASLRFQTLAEQLEQLNAQENVGAALTSTNEKLVSMGLKKLAKGIEKVTGASLNLPPETESGLEVNDTPAKSIASFNGFMKWMLTLTQIEQENADVPGVLKYVEGIRKWWAEKGRLTHLADQRIRELSALSKADRHAFSHFVHEATIKSDEVGRRLNGDELQELMSKWPMGEQAQRLIEETQADFHMILDEIFSVLRADLARRYGHLSPNDRDAVIQQKTQQLTKELQSLKNHNYWPLNRFGQYWVQAKAPKDMKFQGRNFKEGEVFLFETFNTEKEQRARQQQLKKSYGDRIGGGKFSEVEMTFQGMPPQLVGKLKQLMLEGLEINDQMTEEEKATERGKMDEQLKHLDDMLHNLAPGQSFKHRLQRRKGTPGYDMDAIRGYASYMQNAANHISRIKHYAELMDSIGELRTFRKQVEDTDIGNKEAGLEDFLRRHYQYSMNPGNEWANLRALGFLWYLGYVPKSAFVNLTQLPLVTYPHLAAKFGDVKAVGALARAMGDIKKVWTSGTELEPHLRAAVQAGVEAGFLEESLATELAGMAEGSNLQRLLPGSFLKSERAARGIRQVSHLGAWMFQQTEKMNRLITFTAAFRLEMENSGNAETAYKVARDAVENTQYEYARWNRPQLMRGRKSSLFLFKMYLQNTLYFAARNPGSGRYLAMSFLLGGLSGMPFADDLMDLLKIFTSLLGKRFGVSDPLVDMEKDFREMMTGIGVSPDLLLHGASRHTGGIFDLSGSLSMGQVIPGIEGLSDVVTGRRDFAQGLESAVEDVSGPLFAVPLQMMRAMASKSPDRWRETEKMLPKALSNISKAIRRGTRGYETSYSGADILALDYDPTDPIHMAELIGQALGFVPTRVSEEMDKRWAMKQSHLYWSARATHLRMQHNVARKAEDREAIADVKEAIRRFNQQVPNGEYRITGKELSDSWKAKKRNWKKESQGRGITRAQDKLFKDYTEAWTEDAP